LFAIRRRPANPVVDEAAKVTKLEQAWEQAIAPTLIDFGGDAYFLSSPKGYNFFKTLHDRGSAGAAKWTGRASLTRASATFPSSIAARFCCPRCWAGWR
jgi:hypothetical protein